MWRQIALLSVGTLLGAVGSTLVGYIRVRTRCPYCYEPIRIEKLPWQLVPAVVQDHEDEDEEDETAAARAGGAPVG
jgi:hypothetical protein